MIIKIARDIPSSEITSETLYRERRRFMQTSAGWALAAGAASLGIFANAKAALPIRGELDNTITGPYGTSEKPTAAPKP